MCDRNLLRSLVTVRRKRRSYALEYYWGEHYIFILEAILPNVWYSVANQKMPSLSRFGYSVSVTSPKRLSWGQEHLQVGLAAAFPAPTLIKSYKPSGITVYMSIILSLQIWCITSKILIFLCALISSILYTVHSKYRQSLCQRQSASLQNHHW